MAGPWEKYQTTEASGPWAKYASTPTPVETTVAQDIKQGTGNLVAGALRGAGSIGKTILSPIDALARAVNGGKPINVGGYDIAGQDRGAGMDAGLQSMGAEPDSWMYQGGKLAGEIAGTAGAGGAVANGLVRVAPRLATAAPALIDAVRTGGMSANGATGLTGLAARTAGGAITGATSAGLVDPETMGAGALIGGAMPGVAQVVGKGARAVGRAVSGGPVAPEVAALADRANQLGIDIPADRIVNSKPMNAIAATLNYVPFSGRAATEDKMFNQLNTALSRTFGQDSSNVTQALRKANTDLGGKFDTVLQANTVKITPTFKQALADAENQATNELGQEGASIIHKQISNILTKGALGEIDGQAAYNIKKTLDRIGQRNSPEAYYARDLKKSLMDALNDSLGPQEAAAFKGVRQQYGNMLSLEKIAQNGAEGDISVARLANMKNINNPDLQEMADIAAQFLKSRESNHGAAQRTIMGLGGAALGGIPAVAAGATGGRVINSMLNSQAAKNAVLGRSSPTVSNSLRKLLPLTYQSGQLSAQ